MKPASTGRARRGVMLVEILLALAITGLIAGGVASMLFAVAGGTRDRQELRRRNVRMEVVGSRIDGAIRASSMVLGSDAHCLVLWVSDSKKNGNPDLSELRRIEWQPTTKQLVCFQAPASLADPGNTAYSLTMTDFLATTEALRGSASFPATVWANGVSSWRTSLTGVPHATRIISYETTIELPEGGTHTARSTAALRGTSGSAG